MLTSAICDRLREEEFALIVGVGKWQRVFFPPKDLFMDIAPFFRGALGRDWFLEGQNNKVMLPEDDTRLWKLAMDLLDTDDFCPRLKHSKVQCGLRRGPPPHGTYGPRSGRCQTLDVPLHIVDCNGKRILFQHTDIRIGKWTTTELIHLLFDQMVRLFCMAEKYRWTELMDICMLKIDVFPIGRRALATLARNCGCLEAGLLDPCKSAKAGLLRLLDEAYNFHQDTRESSQPKAFNL